MTFEEKWKHRGLHPEAHVMKSTGEVNQTNVITQLLQENVTNIQIQLYKNPPLGPNPTTLT